MRGWSSTTNFFAPIINYGMAISFDRPQVRIELEWVTHKDWIDHELLFTSKMSN